MPQISSDSAVLLIPVNWRRDFFKVRDPCKLANTRSTLNSTRRTRRSVTDPTQRAYIIIK